MYKRILTGAIALALALSAAPSLTFAQQTEPITLRWRTQPGTDAEAAVYTTISAEIDKDWQDVGLTYEGVSQKYVDVLITEIEAGTAPDVYWVPGIETARFASLGLTMNLATLAAADTMFKTTDFYQQPMQFLTTGLDGKIDATKALWGLPRDVSSFGIYYNAELFDAAGLDYPGGADWTWDRFYKSAEAIRKLGADTYGFGMGSWWAHWGNWINGAGGSLFNTDYSACALNTDKAKVGLDFLYSLYKNELTVPFGTNVEPAFTAGKVGMFQNGRWATPNLVKNTKFRWNVAPLPTGPGGDANWVFWGAYAVNPKTKHPQEAWELLRRLTAVTVQNRIAELGVNIPSRDTTDATSVFLGTYADLKLNNQVWVNTFAKNGG